MLGSLKILVFKQLLSSRGDHHLPVQLREYATTKKAGASAA
jgi:hypothetical protein